jgi:succinate dehydrogenase/fumarate reductase iron-sulfur protein
MAETISITVHRFDPDTDRQGHLETYQLAKTPAMRVLNVIRVLNEGGANIAVRYYCEEFLCGSCAVAINGVPQLACKTEVQDGMVIEPIPHWPLIKDLLVDRCGDRARHRDLDRLPEKKNDTRLDYPAFTRLWKAITCIRCGICLASCPLLHARSGSYTYIGAEFMLSLFRSQFDPRTETPSLEAAQRKGIWECTACNQCVENCPQTIPITDLLRQLRESTIDTAGNLVPPPIRDLNERLFKYHNPFGIHQKKRMQWAGDLDLPPMTDQRRVLYVIGCDQCFNPRDQEVARAMVTVLRAAEVDFGTLGREEVNTGEPALTTGEMGLFEELAAINIAAFKKYPETVIVTTSPHDFHVIKNKYPELGGTFRVLHYTQLIEDLINIGMLNLAGRVDKTVVYHDPCFLGRYNGVYESPRRILKAIPGLNLVEMNANRQQARCCGGGGGGNWLDVPAGERLAERRVARAAATGAHILAVACPICLAMFEDALKTTGLEDTLEVKQIIELVGQALGEGQNGFNGNPNRSIPSKMVAF